MPQLDLFAGPHLEKLAAQSAASVSLQMPPDPLPDVEPESQPIVEPAPIEQPTKLQATDWRSDTVHWSGPPSGDPRVVLIVDAPAILEQAAHVPKVREIIGPNGCPAGLVRSFSKTFLRLLGQHKPDLVAVVFDGQSEESDLELRMQTEICRTLCEFLGCSTIASAKARCVDVIGTLASLCPADWPVIVASNRTSLLQLGQRPDLAFTYWQRGEPITEHADVDCRRRVHVMPHQVAAYLALVGLPGVGEASARIILQYAVKTERALLDLIGLGDSFGIAAGLPSKMRGRIRVAQALLDGRDGLADAMRAARLVRDVSDPGEVPMSSELEQRLCRRERDDAGLRLVGETWGIKELRGDYDSD